MKNETYDEEPGLGGNFPGREKHGLGACAERVRQGWRTPACRDAGLHRVASFSRSLHGCDACVARVTRDGHPGLARSRDCVAQWIYGGPENSLPISAPEHEKCPSRIVPARSVGTK